MATELLDLADRLLTGDADIARHHPFDLFGDLAELDRERAFVAAFANVGRVRHRRRPRPRRHEQPVPRRTRPRRRRAAGATRPLHTAVFTHGHIDHVLRRGALRSRTPVSTAGARPQVVAHEAIAARFDRYVETAGYNAVINRGSSGAEELQWPTDYRYPDETYRDRLDLEVGGERVRAPPRPRRDRRPHLGVGAGRAGAVHRRPLHLGVAELRQPAEGRSATRTSGPRALRDDGDARARGAAARARPADRRRRPCRTRRSPTPRRCSSTLHDETITHDERGRAPRRHRAHGARARAPARAAVPPPDLRRARVRRAQRVAPLRRLVRRQPRAPQAGARGRDRAASSPALAGGAGRLAARARRAGRRRRPPPRRATSRSGPRSRHPTTGRCTGSAPRSSSVARPPRPRR